MLLTDSLTRLGDLVQNDAPKHDIRALIATAHETAQALESDARFTQLESQVSALTSERDNLQAQLQEAKLTMERFTESEEKRRAQCTDAAHGILLYIHSADKPTTEEVAQALAVSVSVADFHVENLRIDRLITGHDPDMHPGWFLTREGHRYLVERGLL